MRDLHPLAYGLIGIGLLFLLATADAARRGVIVDRSTRVSRDKEPRSFCNGLLFFGGYGVVVMLAGAFIWWIA